jgi:glycosyltransferase involved in cell wall biosynthesis
LAALGAPSPIPVLFLTDNPTLGGTIRVLQSWLLLAPDQGVLPFVAAPPGSRFTEWLDAHRISRTESAMPWPDRRRPWRSLRAVWRLARWARAHGVSVVHCNEHNVYPFGAPLAHWLRVPVVCHVRFSVTREFAAWAFGGRRCPDALLWTSRQQRSDSAAAVEGIVPDQRQHLVPLGLDLSKFGNRLDERERARSAWGVAADQIVIGQAAAIRPRKRLEDFIDAVERLEQLDARVLGIIAGDAMPGDETYRDTLHQLVRDRGLSSVVRFLGNLDDIEPFYQGIDIAVSTSEYETFGNSVCEAMACARPLVGYTGGSVAEVVGTAGRIVANGDVGALSSALGSLVSDPALRKRLGDAARQRVAEEFSPARSFSTVVGIYQRLTGAPAAALSAAGAQ